MNRRGNTGKHRWSIVSRALAASAGGYAVVTLLAAALALCLPMPRLEAVVTATLISFLVYAAIIMAVFHARSAGRAWLGLAILAAPLTTIVLLLLHGAHP